MAQEEGVAKKRRMFFVCRNIPDRGESIGSSRLIACPCIARRFPAFFSTWSALIHAVMFLASGLALATEGQVNPGTAPPPRPHSKTHGNIMEYREGPSPNLLYFEEMGDTKAANPSSPTRPRGAPMRQSAPALAKPQVLAAPRGSAAPQITAAPKSPNTGKLWQLLEQERYAEVLAEIDRLRARHPAWRPPRAMVSLAKKGQFTQRVNEAIAAADHQTLVQLASSHPGEFDCRHLARGHALAEAHSRLGQGVDARRIALRLVQCPGDEARVVTLEKSRSWLPAETWEDLVQVASAASVSPATRHRAQRLVYEARLQRLRAAAEIKEKDAREDTRAALLFGTLEAAVEENRDAGAALSGAWIYLNAGDTARAALWFHRALQWDPLADEASQAHGGLAYVALRERRFADALREAELLPAGATGLAELKRDALIGEGGQAYAEGRFQEAFDLMTRAGLNGGLPRYASTIQAWSLLKIGRPQESADHFAKLFLQQPDEESAEGVLQSHRGAGRESELRRLSSIEPLQTLLKRSLLQQAINEKRFLAARSLRTDVLDASGAVGTPRISVYALARDKAGNSGLSALHHELQPASEVAHVAGEAGELQLRLDRVLLTSGALPDAAQVGSFPRPPGGYTRAPLTRVAGWQPRLFWRNEALAVWSFDLGMTPSGGVIATRPYGRVARTTHETWGQLAAAVFVEPVRESLLSYVGLHDPYRDPNAGGVAWGRVLRNGAEIRALRLAEAPWSFGARLRRERLLGQGVANNTRTAVDATVGKDLKLDGFDYAVLGIGVSSDQYDKNLSGFTRGHGGYFSPQRYVRAGLAFDFMTAENQRWMARGRATVGRVSKSENETPLFPFAPDGRVSAANRGVGNDAGVEVSGVWRVTDHVQAGLAFSRSVSPQFSSTTAGLFVRILMHSRKNVLSADLPGQIMADIN